jgi:hypothetical protein
VRRLASDPEEVVAPGGGAVDDLVVDGMVPVAGIREGADREEVGPEDADLGAVLGHGEVEDEEAGPAAPVLGFAGLAVAVVVSAEESHTSAGPGGQTSPGDSPVVRVASRSETVGSRHWRCLAGYPNQN